MTAQQLQNIGARVRQADPYGIGVYVDPENPTNEEMAQLILDTMSTYMKDVVRKIAEAEQRETNAGSVTAAGDTAVADLE